MSESRMQLNESIMFYVRIRTPYRLSRLHENVQGCSSIGHPTTINQSEVGWTQVKFEFENG